MFPPLAWWTYDRLLKVFAFLIVIVGCGLTPMQGDSWWQLRAGQDMWTAGRVLLTDVYSHTAYGEYWLNHEWLTEVSYYAAYRIGGLPAVTLFATALITAGWLVSWRLGFGAARTRLAWMVPALVPSSLWWEPRPHAWSLLLIPACVYLLSRERYTLLPPAFLIWANCHGGVLLGLVIVSAALAPHALTKPGFWWKGALVIGACMVAMTLTPLGAAFWIEIPKSLARIRLYPLDEWKRTPLFDAHLLPYWIVASAFCVALVVRRGSLRDASLPQLTLYTSALALLPMSALAIRNVGPFLMLAVPAMTHLMPVGAAAAPRRTRARLNLALAATACATVVTVLGWAYWKQIPRLRWHPIPADAQQALRQCPDNLYNRYDEGGSLIWFVPERRVFLDGRQDPFEPALVLEHIGMEARGDDYRRVFERHGIRCAYLPAGSPTARRLHEDGWRALYRDPRWVVLSQ